MKYYGLTTNLKDDPEIIRKYKEHHKAVYPEVLKSLRGIGILSMDIFFLGRRLFMMMTTVDDFEPERDFARHMETGGPRVVEWEKKMMEFQERVPEGPKGAWWAPMEHLFHMEP